jgi:hypothetical protein
MSKRLLAGLALAAVLANSPVSAAVLLPGSSIDMAGYVNATGGATINNATFLDFLAGPQGAPSPGAPGVSLPTGMGPDPSPDFLAWAETAEQSRTSR